MIKKYYLLTYHNCELLIASYLFPVDYADFCRNKSALICAICGKMFKFQRSSEVFSTLSMKIIIIV